MSTLILSLLFAQLAVAVLGILLGGILGVVFKVDTLTTQLLAILAGFLTCEIPFSTFALLSLSAYCVYDCCLLYSKIRLNNIDSDIENYSSSSSSEYSSDSDSEAHSPDKSSSYTNIRLSLVKDDKKTDKIQPIKSTPLVEEPQITDRDFYSCNEEEQEQHKQKDDEEEMYHPGL